ncbi:hypothetical protein EXN66_Car001238 [Channa argus]|uniref:Uncharacterized protein n=1 Tax=Channa argus TaxID=215402 RepID=A0A6G1QZV7_CHAAH|nr:hypothetical protein EXN66_Car001238 [Channa argus]
MGSQNEVLGGGVGWGVSEMTESVFKKDNHCLGKNKQILIEIYLLLLEIKTILCVSFTFLFQI